MKIIAFGHRKKVGKDTAANFLMSHYRTNVRNSNIKKRGFADKVKDVAFDLYSHLGLMPGDWYEEADRQNLKDVPLKCGKTPRSIWIHIGNRCRDLDPLVWVKKLLTSEKCEVLIVKDLRFPEEADEILRMGGRIYKIERDSQAKDTDGADDPLESFTKWSGIIKNNESLGSLYTKVVEIAYRWLIS